MARWITIGWLPSTFKHTPTIRYWWAIIRTPRDDSQKARTWVRPQELSITAKPKQLSLSDKILVPDSTSTIKHFVWPSPQNQLNKLLGANRDWSPNHRACLAWGRSCALMLRLCGLVFLWEHHSSMCGRCLWLLCLLLEPFSVLWVWGDVPGLFVTCYTMFG